MPLLTIIEHYVLAALKRAEGQRLEDGTIIATVPDAPGVVASGADAHECSLDLYARLEDWVKVSLAQGHKLPPIDGIDLNSQSSWLLATYHAALTTPESTEVYSGGDELEAAFAERDRRAP